MNRKTYSNTNQIRGFTCTKQKIEIKTKFEPDNKMQNEKITETKKLCIETIAVQHHIRYGSFRKGWFSHWVRKLR